MNNRLLTVILFLSFLAGSLRLTANPEVIADLAKFDTIFTGYIIKVGDRHACMIDRVLKGDVNPVLMAYVKGFATGKLPIGMHILFTTIDAQGHGFQAFFAYDGMISYT